MNEILPVLHVLALVISPFAIAAALIILGYWLRDFLVGFNNDRTRTRLFRENRHMVIGKASGKSSGRTYSS
jgi:hypothetical protein